MPQRRLLSIKARILWVNIGFIFFAFLGILLIFNVLMNNYISNNAKNQLAKVVTFQSNADQGTAPSGTPNLDNAPRGLFNTHPAAFEISANYQPSLPATMSDLDKNVAQSIAAALKSQNVKVGSLNNFRLETNDSTFYIETSPTTDNHYLLLYVDISGITNFSRSVNFFLILIALAVILVMTLAVTVVTQRIVRPLSQLAAFARRIGQGDLTPDNTDFHDLEMATLADTMNATARQLGDREQEQKAFFQNASHELRTPLMVIKSYAEGISYDIMPAKEASETIMKETDRMSELVEDLLTLSRIDSLNKPEEFARNALQDIFMDVASEQEAFAVKQNLKFTYFFDKKPIYYWSNYKALRRAISNLIANSLRYAENEVQLTCHVQKGKIFLMVANDGEAIAEKDLPHLFERFYKGKGGVHGIGLSIVKAVAEQHGGSPFAENHNGWVRFGLLFDEKRKN